jgi:hypothetical protein
VIKKLFRQFCKIHKDNICKMRKSLFIFFVLTVSVASAQDSTISILKKEATRTIPTIAVDTIKKKWIKGGLFNLNVSQSSLKDWAAGGDAFSMALSLYTNAHAYYKNNKITWDNNVDLNFGYINTTSLGSRKGDDRFDFLSKYGYSLNSKVSASALFDLRTQFFDGYTYPAPKTPVFSSTAFSPGYVLFSPGIDYKPVNGLSIFASPVSSRWVVVVNKTLSAQGAYGVDTGKYLMSQVGAFGTIIFNSKFTKTITYNARIDLFSNYQHNPQNIDLYMTNLFAAKFTKLFSVTWGLDMIYDDDARIFGPDHNAPRLQIKSVIGIGILLKAGT